MKCVAEIRMMKEKAERDYVAEQARLDILAVSQHKERIKNTIDFCETTVNQFFIDKAKSRVDKPCFKLFCKVGKDRIGIDTIFDMDEQKSNYADNRPEYLVGKPILDLETFIAYLTQHCYKVNIHDSYYWCYGCGACGCNLIEVEL